MIINLVPVHLNSYKEKDLYLVILLRFSKSYLKIFSLAIFIFIKLKYMVDIVI